MYRSKYVMKEEPLPTGERLVIGSVIDTLLSEYYGGRLEEITLDEVEHYFKIERARSADTGADWMLEDKWKLSKRQDLFLKIIDLLYMYIEEMNKEGVTTVATQKHVEGVIEGQKFHGYIDWIYKDKNGKGVIVDWKVKAQRSQLDFTHAVQLSVYAYLTGTSNIEAHYLVPYTKTVGWIRRDTKPLNIELIKSLIKRREIINKGGEVILNPNSRLCSPKWCQAWYGCLAGELRHS